MVFNLTIVSKFKRQFVDVTQYVKRVCVSFKRLLGSKTDYSAIKHFNDSWYLQQYQDVSIANVDPMLHYLSNGMAEGRSPYLGAKLPAPKNYTRNSYDALYSGYEHRVFLSGVESLNDQAFLGLATWLAACGTAEQARSLLQRRGNNHVKAYQVARLKLDLLDGVPTRHKFQDIFAQCLYSKKQTGNFESSGLNKLWATKGLIGLNVAQALKSIVTEPVHPISARQKISIVMPAYNAERTLSYAVRSCLAQSWQNIELIIINDGSTDSTLALAEQLAQNDHRVQVIANKVPLGAYASRNIGMKAAKGEFVTVHDADDWSHPQKLEKQMQPLLDNPDVVATFSHWVRVTEDMEIVGPWMLNAEFVEKNHSSLLLRASVLEQTGLWDEVRVAADTEYLWRLEHHFGHKAIVSVLPMVPLSFALSANTTLTQASATHVKTTMYGLRRIYREASQWWHRKEGFKPVLQEGERPFPLPLGMLKVLPQVAHVIAADFTDESCAFKKQLKEAVDKCLEQYGANICFLHLPQYTKWHLLAIADHVFDIAHQHGFSFVNPGISLNTSAITLLNNVKLAECPTSIAKFPKITEVHGKGANSELWLEYFQKGLHPEAKNVPLLREVYGAD